MPATKMKMSQLPQTVCEVVLNCVATWLLASLVQAGVAQGLNQGTVTWIHSARMRVMPLDLTESCSRIICSFSMKTGSCPRRVSQLLDQHLMLLEWTAATSTLSAGPGLPAEVSTEMSAVATEYHMQAPLLDLIDQRNQQ